MRPGRRPGEARDFAEIDKNEIRSRFDQEYKKIYGRTYPDTPIEFINFKVRVSLASEQLQLSKLENIGGSLPDAVKGRRMAYSPTSGDFIDYTVYNRYGLFPNAAFQGPAIIEERESTLIVGEDASVSVDEYGFLWIDIQ